MLTKIPLEGTRWTNNFESGKLSSKDLYCLLKLATNESSFSFDNNLYKQIDRVTIGSALGPTLANAFLCHYAKIWLSKCPSLFKSVLYRHDIFLFSLNLNNS